jgi:hypothetical protein
MGIIPALFHTSSETLHSDENQYIKLARLMSLQIYW